MRKAAARRRGHGERGVGRERGGLAKEWGQTGRGDMQQSGNSDGGDETRKQKLGDGDDGNEANIPPTATAMGMGRRNICLVAVVSISQFLFPRLVAAVTVT